MLGVNIKLRPFSCRKTALIKIDYDCDTLIVTDCQKLLFPEIY